eukprot:comp21999_c0_seq1/m.31825 comp21999_c0_seq1/g.31825  ORF comp21999_c0_seq1/g.31825 comp21999_c0_seq1/m.31825 type:complete len:145 (-) comp21999_c0_seq1:579-1013(-)
MNALLFITGALCSAVFAAPVPRPIQIGPLTMKDITYEYKAGTPTKACDGVEYLLGSSGPVYDFSKPQGYEYPVLCETGYVLFQKQEKGWYLVSGERQCLNVKTDQEAFTALLAKYGYCKPLATAVTPEPTQTLAFFDLLDELFE